GGPAHRRRLDRHLSVHDRQGARRHHRPLPRAQAAAGGARRSSAARGQRAPHRAGHELPALGPSPSRPVKTLRVLTLVHKGLEPPDRAPAQDRETAEWKMEYDVVHTLRALGHEPKVIGVHDDLTPIRSSMDDFKPDITFNLMEAFADVGVFDQN